MVRKLSRNYSLIARAKVPLNIFDGGPRFGSTKLATAVICAALVLAALFALLLAARPAQAQTETVLYNFTGGSDGGKPQSSLIFDGAGNLYGMTDGGGAFGAGTVFELSPNGSGGWNETVLYSFTGGADGANPIGPVMFDSVGNLYGTAQGGGANGYGVVFELSPVGAGWTETVLHSFAGGADGANPPNGLIMDPAGNLYGTTYNGGVAGHGTVFELSPSGGGWTERVIYTGDAPFGDAGLTRDAAGNIFGATLLTVFELSPNGNGGWNPTVIHTFTGAPRDGRGPEGTPVLDKSGNLYGTTYQGGAKNLGTVYKLSHGAQGWTEKILHSFMFTDGAYVRAGVLLDAAGNIYGTTADGGKHLYYGTVFELVAGAGIYKEKFFWSFGGRAGIPPYPSSLILDSAGNLYGTTQMGGSQACQYGCGGVFEVTGWPAATRTTLTSSPNPSIPGQTVTFTAVVVSSAGAPNGQAVTFWHGTTVLGTGVLSGGSASFTTSTLNLGTTRVTAVYGGDYVHFLGSGSNTVEQVVVNYTTTTALSSSLNPSNYGQRGTLMATVTSAGPAPTGTVTFRNGSAMFSRTLNASGVATLTTAKFPLGANTLTATYNGNTSYAKSVSAAITQTVRQAAISMVLTSNSNPSAFDTSVKFTAKLTSNGGLPTGQPVTFSYNGATLGTANVDSIGVATFYTTTALPQGSDLVTAAYAGSVDYSAASATVTQVVN